MPVSDAAIRKARIEAALDITITVHAETFELWWQEWDQERRERETAQEATMDESHESIS